MKIRVIVNPRAGAGAARRRMAAIERAFRDAGASFDVAETRAPREATDLAHRARDDGVEVIAVVGGDGTLNEVVQAYLDDSGCPVPGPAIAVVPAGTGGDFRRTLGLGKDPAEAVARLLSAPVRELDLGVVEVVGDRGEPVRRAFLNIGSFGVSGKIDRLVNRSPKWMGGRVAFALGTIRAMSTYRNALVSIHVDGNSWYEGRIVFTALANGQYFGGGMHVAPHADPSDGLLDVITVGDVGFQESMRISPRLYTGRHLDHPLVKTTRGVKIEAVPLDGRPVFVDTDGETPGRLPLRARLFPAALALRA